MKIIVGLGNPSKHYVTTRHNAGFRVLDRLGTECGETFSNAKHLQAEISKTTLVSKTVLLVKPLTFMNLSGLSVAAVASWYKAPLEDFLIVHDDVSLPLGKLRFQKAGSAGGQHGVESIITSLGGVKNFNRLKIGVGPDPGGELRADYVLSAVPEAQRSLYDEVIDQCAQAVAFWLDQGIDAAMRQFNGINLSL